MMQELERTFPSSRQTMQSFNQAQTLEWNYVAPKGKRLLSLYVDANITTAGAGMSTVNLSNAINSLQAYNESILAMDVDQFSLDLFAGYSKFVERVGESIDGYRTGSPAYLDPANVATGASLYGRWKLFTPLPGKAFRFVANLLSMQTVFGTGMTGGVLSVSVVPIWTPIDQRVPPNQFTIYAREFVGTQKGYLNAYNVALFAPNEWNGISGGIDMGGKLTGEMITRMQDYYDDELVGYITQSGSAANPDVKPLTDGNNAASDVFCLARVFDTPTTISVQVTSSKTIKAVVFSNLPADKVAVNLVT